MSAFMCSEKHLTVLASYALRFNLYGAGGISPEQPNREILAAAFRLLARENGRSLDARYPGDSAKDSIELLRPSKGGAAEFLDFPAVAIVKLCHCYAYQACEHRGWAESFAKKLVDTIEAHAVRRMPGYEQAPWGL